MSVLEEASNFCPCSLLLHLVAVFGSKVLGFVQNSASAVSVCCPSASWKSSPLLRQHLAFDMGTMKLPCCLRRQEAPFT